MADMKTKAAPQSDNANSISADGAKIATTLGAAVTLLGGAAFGFSRLEPEVSAAAVNALAETRQISPEGRAAGIIQSRDLGNVVLFMVKPDMIEKASQVIEQQGYAVIAQTKNDGVFGDGDFLLVSTTRLKDK